MAGKMCIGNSNVPNNPILTKTYCEGRRASIDGVLKILNPFPNPSEEHSTWDRGHDSYDGAGTVYATDCCADQSRAV